MIGISNAHARWQAGFQRGELPLGRRRQRRLVVPVACWPGTIRARNQSSTARHISKWTLPH